MKVLISGAGVAGPCLAFWLRRYGHEPVIVERAPALRRGGYVIDFWGAGFDVAERMGLVPVLRERGYAIRELRQVDTSGRRVSGFGVDAITRVMGDRFTSLPRSDLAACLYEALGGQVEAIFGDSITAIEDTGASVRVGLERAAPRTFDLVVGADGLHSRVRQLSFGPQERFDRYLGLKVAAFEVPGYRPRDELVYVLFPMLGGQVGRVSLRDDRTLFLFTFSDPDPAIPPGLEGQKAVLRERFGGTGWETGRILEALDACEALYFDRVSQIVIERWTKGRVALVGDAAFCVSFLAGQGSALAMTAAYVLAGELSSGADVGAALERYETRLRPLIATKQRAAGRFAGFFAPRTRLSILLRGLVMRLMSLPFVTELAAGRELRDAITLPDYSTSCQPGAAANEARISPT